MTAAYGNEQRETRAFRAHQRGDHARRFRAAARHSRRVRLLRAGLPVATVIGCLLLALASWLNPLRILTRLPISVGDVVVSGTKIKMENPKLSGFTRDSRRYDVTAGAAAQDLTRPGVVELHDLTAMLEMQQNSSMRLVAQNGLFDTKKEQLTLQRNIVVTSSGGYEGYLDEAVIDTKNGNVVSEKPVLLKMLNGTVNANRFELTQSGDIIRFENGVVVNLKLDNKASSQNHPAAAQPAATTP
jgi:lipopolysaccharide export system protein LptC